MELSNLAMQGQESRNNQTKNDGSSPEIEFAEQGGVGTMPSDLPAIVDIHGDVIKADWHAIREKANTAEAYEHSIGIWEACKIYKKVGLLTICGHGSCRLARR
jgi:hypothetical protein